MGAFPGRSLWGSFFFFTFVLALLPAAGCSSYPAKRTPAWVEEVLDGDTLVVEVGGRRERVRLIGLDAPEDSPRRVEPLGPEATSFARREVKGRMVYLEPGREKRDRYRRLLAYVWLSRDSTAPEDLLNYRLLERGLARLYLHPPNLDHALVLWRAERGARQRGVGIWKGSPGWR